MIDSTREGLAQKEGCLGRTTFHTFREHTSHLSTVKTHRSIFSHPWVVSVLSFALRWFNKFVLVTSAGITRTSQMRKE